MLLFYHLLKLVIILCFLSEFYSITIVVSLNSMELKAQLYIDSNRSQLAYYLFLDIRILKGIRVINQDWIIFNPILVRLEIIRSSSDRSRYHIIDSLWINSSWDNPTNKCNCMRCPSINSNILWLLFSL